MRSWRIALIALALTLSACSSAKAWTHGSLRTTCPLGSTYVNSDGLADPCVGANINSNFRNAGAFNVASGTSLYQNGQPTIGRPVTLNNIPGVDYQLGYDSTLTLLDPKNSAQFRSSISGSVMTVTAITSEFGGYVGTIAVGQMVDGWDGTHRTPVGLTITGDALTSDQCAGIACTGAGGLGTYLLSATATLTSNAASNTSSGLPFGWEWAPTSSTSNNAGAGPLLVLAGDGGQATTLGSAGVALGDAWPAYGYDLGAINGHDCTLVFVAATSSGLSQARNLKFNANDDPAAGTGQCVGIARSSASTLSGTTFTASGTSYGHFRAHQVLTNAAILDTTVTIVSQTSGTPAGDGVYVVLNPNNYAVSSPSAINATNSANSAPVYFIRYQGTASAWGWKYLSFNGNYTNETNRMSAWWDRDNSVGCVMTASYFDMHDMGSRYGNQSGVCNYQLQAFWGDGESLWNPPPSFTGDHGEILDSTNPAVITGSSFGSYYVVSNPASAPQGTDVTAPWWVGGVPQGGYSGTVTMANGISINNKNVVGAATGYAIFGLPALSYGGINVHDQWADPTGSFFCAQAGAAATSTGSTSGNTYTAGSGTWYIGGYLVNAAAGFVPALITGVSGLTITFAGAPQAIGAHSGWQEWANPGTYTFANVFNLRDGSAITAPFDPANNLINMGGGVCNGHG